MSAIERGELTLDALGNSVRREIIRLLLPGPLSVGTLAAELPISRPAVSRHLRILRHAELVTEKAEGNRNLIYLNPVGFAAARSWLNPFWDEALARFAAIAEASAEGEE